MADQRLIKQFKEELLSQGINWDDDKINNYLTLRQAGENVATEMRNEALKQRDQRIDMFSSYRPDTAPKIPQQDKNAMWDFTGNLLWEAMDSATFGALEWSGIADPLEKALSGEEGPETFAGRVGAGLGGFAGFLVPMTGTAKALSAGARAMKGGTKYAQKQLLKEGTEYLGTKSTMKIKDPITGKISDITGKGYKSFNRLTEVEKADVFKPFVDDISEFGNRLGNLEVRDAYKARFGANLQKEIAYQLRKAKIRPTQENLSSIEAIIKRAAGVSKNSTLPIWSLEQKIKVALGSTIGAGKTASIAATALAEGITFAAVETPFELFQSMEEEREADYLGRAKHAFILGTTLGLIKYVPGGKQFQQGGILREGLKRWNLAKKKRPYADYDMTDANDRKALMTFAKSLYNNTGTKIFQDKAVNLGIPNSTYIQAAAGSKKDAVKNAKKIQQAMIGIEREFLKGSKGKNSAWFDEFKTEASEDLIGSVPRMIMGSMAFNHEVVLDEYIPLEDKVFHTLLGAWMTKRGRVLEYTNVSGGKEKHVVGDYNRPGDRFTQINEYLTKLRIDPMDYNFRANVASENLGKKFTMNIEQTDDVQAIKNIVKEAVVQDSGVSIPKPKNAGKSGENPIYDYMRAVYDRQIGLKDNTRLKAPEEMTVKEIKAIEKKLKKYDFESIIEPGGIDRLSKIDDIFFAAADKNMNNLINNHVEAAIEIYNSLAGSHIITRPSDSKVLPELYDIIPIKQGRKLSAENQELLNTYKRIIDVLDGRFITVNRDNSRRLAVEDADFKNGAVEKIVRKYEKALDDIIYGDKIPAQTRAHQLAEEGMIGELIAGQSFYKGIRNLHARFNDPANSKNTWRTREDSEVSDGEILFGYDKLNNEGNRITEQGLITELLFDNNGNLYKTIEFGKSVSESNKQMISTLHKILGADPNKNFSAFDAQTSNGKITQDNISNLKSKLETVRNILYENGLQNLIYKDAFQARQFVAKYQDYAFKTFLKSSVKRNGEPLNEFDRATISTLLDYGILGPNFQLTNIIGIVENLQSLAQTKSLAGLSVKAGALYDGKKRFTYTESDFAALDGPIGMKNSMKALEQHGITTKQQIDLLLKTYKEILEPLMTDPNNPGVGIIKPHPTAIAQVSEGQLSDLIFKLDTINKQKESVFHDNLLEQLQNIKNDKKLDFSESDRQSLEYLYSLYGTGTASTSKLIQAMSQRKLYRFDKDKLVIDPADKSLKEKLKEVINDIEFDINSQSDALTLEHKMNQFKTFESKDSEVMMKQNITKQSLISKYNLPKDVEFKRNDIENVLDHAKIINNDKSVSYFRDTRKSPTESYKLMNDSQQTQFLFELAKVYNGVLGSKTVSRLSVTEGYGVWSTPDYITSNNHYFEGLDALVGKGNWHLLDLDMVNKKNGVSNARTDMAAKKHLYTMVYTMTKGIDSKLRENDAGILPYEKGSGSVPIDIPGVKWSVAVKREALRKLGPVLDKKLKAFEKEYSDPKYKDLHRQLKKHFKNIVETKEINGKKEMKWKESDAFQEGESLGTILNFINHDSWMKKWWWDHAAEVHNTKNDLLGVKLARRIKMFANTGMRMLSDEQLDFTIKLLEKNVTNKAELRKNESYLGLKKLKKNKGMRIAIARDENFEIGGREFSTLKELKKQLDAEIKASDKVRNFIEVKEKDGELTFEGGGDISKVDSYMVVEPTVLAGYLGLNGAGHIAGTGGIKPMIHRTGSGIILGKTAFVTDPKMVKFFKNNKLDGILMESGAKIMNENTKIFTEFDSMESLSKAKLPKEYHELLELKDISLGMVVKPNSDATLPYQTTNHLNKSEARALYDNYLKDNLTSFVNDTQNYFNTADPLAGLAQAKMMSSSGTTLDNTSLYSRWINSNGFIHSPLVAPDFIRQVKSSRIDNGGIMSMKTKYGGQAVNSPGEGLRFTTFTRRQDGTTGRVYTYGEMQMGRIHGDKRIDLNNLHIIEHNPNSRDRLLSYKDLLKENLSFDREIYEITNKVKMMEDPTFIASDGKARDVWVVDNISAARTQLALIKAGAGGGANFGKIKKQEDGYYVLEHKKGDNKHIYIRSEEPYKKIFKRLEEDPSKVPGMYTKKMELNDTMNLYEAFNQLNNIGKQNNRNFQIAVVVRRNPSTRPGDMVIAGLKDFLAPGYGNQTKLNASDFTFRLEGDYDVDKTDFFWDTPTSVLKKWDSLSGEVLRVNPDTYASGNKTSLRRKNSSGLIEKFDWLNPESVSNWDQNLAKSEKFRGTIVKMQRTLAALENYDASSNFIISGKDGKRRGGFALNLKNVENGGYIYLSKSALKEQRRLLAEDIQNITDSLTGFNDRIYNENWRDTFLFGGAEGRYSGIFKRAAYDKNKKIWTEHPTQGLGLTQTEKVIIAEAIKPYDAMLQLGTSLFRNGKQEKVRYEDLLSGIQAFDISMANLAESVYWKLKKRGTARTKVDKAELDKYFINKSTKKVDNIFGDFGANIRPGLLADTKTAIADQFANMLPFERAMSVLVHNDYMKIELPGRIDGEMLGNFNKFYKENMFGENFDKVGREYIKALQKNDKMFGYINYLAYNISKQQNAKRNALKNNHISLSEVIAENIVNLEAQKKQLEKELIFGETEFEGSSQAMRYAQKLRDGIVSLHINDVYKYGKLPNDWNAKAKPADRALEKHEMQNQHFDNSTPEGRAKITAWVSANNRLFRNYAKKKGVVKFEGVVESDQLGSIITANATQKYQNIGIRDIYTGGDKAIEMDQDVAYFTKFRNETWRGTLSGKDWSMDATKSSNILTSKLDMLFDKWNKQGQATDDGGHGMLFLLKLMAPKEKENTFTYLHGRIAPAYQNNSMNMARFVAKYIANAPETRISEITKTEFIDHMSTFFNNSFRAVHGYRPEGTNYMLGRMSNKLMEASDVFQGAPLIDNIQGFKPGFTETHLNDNLSLLFGSRESLTGIFGGSIVDPSAIGRASSLMRYSYSPVGYIPESTNIMNYPSINGAKNYYEAIKQKNITLLGNATSLNLLFNRTPKLELNAYDKISDTGSNRGYESMKQLIMKNCIRK